MIRDLLFCASWPPGLCPHGYITTRVPWERFHGGCWWGICGYTLLDGRPGEQQPQHKAPRTLSIRVAQWITFSCKMEDRGLDSLVDAYANLVRRVDKLVKKGEPSLRSSDS